MKSKLPEFANWTDSVRGELTGELLAEYTLVGGTYTIKALNTYALGLISSNREGMKRYFHFDGLGSTTALADENEVVKDNYTYEAFGVIATATSTNGPSVNPFKFVGQWGYYDDGAMGSAAGLYCSRGHCLDSKHGTILNGDVRREVECTDLNQERDSGTRVPRAVAQQLQQEIPPLDPFRFDIYEEGFLLEQCLDLCRVQFDNHFRACYRAYSECLRSKPADYCLAVLKKCKRSAEAEYKGCKVWCQVYFGYGVDKPWLEGPIGKPRKQSANPDIATASRLITIVMASGLWLVMVSLATIVLPLHGCSRSEVNTPNRSTRRNTGGDAPQEPGLVSLSESDICEAALEHESLLRLSESREYRGGTSDLGRLMIDDWAAGNFRSLWSKLQPSAKSQLTDLLERQLSDLAVERRFTPQVPEKGRRD